MAYGTIKVDTITFTDAGVDKSVTISGLVQNPTFSGNITVTGTVSGNTIQGQTVSGATITGGVVTITSGVFGLGSASNPSISFTGDANTGFYSPGADQVAVATNGTGRLFINDNGQIGIGTNTSLLYPLNIQSGSGADAIMLRGRLVDDKSTILFVNNGAVTNLGWIQVDATGFAIATGSAPTERLRIDATGQIEAASLGTAAAPTFSWTGDPNTGIYSPGADQVAISTGGSGRLFVDASGRVGVNTASPQRALHSSGGVSDNCILATSIAGNAFIGFADVGTTDQTGLSVRLGSSGNSLVFQTGGTSERLRITSAGLVGIGTSSPGTLLNVAGGVTRLTNGAKAASNTYLQLYSNDASNQMALEFNNSTNAYWSIQSVENGISFKPLVLNASGGNVGIGSTTSPSYLLDVAGTTRIGAATGDATLEIGAGASANRNAYIDLVGDTTYTDYGTRIIRQGGGANADSRIQHRGTGALALETAEAGAAIAFIQQPGERARIDSSGRLLVGTSSSVAALVNAGLQVHGTAGSSWITSARWSNDIDNPGYVFAKSRGASVGTRGVLANGDFMGVIYFTGDDGTNFINSASIAAVVDGTPGTNDMPGRLVFSTTADGASSPTERLRITSAGLVGIGTSTAESTLHVNGNITVGYPTQNQSSTNLIQVRSQSDPADKDKAAINLGTTAGATSSSSFIEFFTNNYGVDRAARMRIDPQGRVGIGTSSPSDVLHVVGGGRFTGSAVSLDVSGAFIDYSSNIARIAGCHSSGGTITFLTNPNAGFNTERARIDSSGRLLVGTSSNRTGAAFQIEGTTFGTSLGTITNNSANSAPAYFQLIKSRGTSVGSQALVANGDGLGNVQFIGADGTQQLVAAAIEGIVDGTPGTNDMPGRLVFSTTADGASSPTERMRIANNGAITVSNAADNIFASSNVSPGTSNFFFLGFTSGSSRVVIWNNGNVVNTNNSYGAISDVKLKENIVDANSQWDDLKALQVRNYNFKEGQTHTQIGLVAQEAELVSPGLVSESPDRDAEGNDLGTVTKSVNYSVLYMKAVKALQEAMERIEVLEQRLTDAGIA